jgi:hypothetical protein
MRSIVGYHFDASPRCSQRGGRGTAFSNRRVSKAEEFPIVKYDWDADVEGALAKRVSIFPEVVRERWRQRIAYNAEKIAAYKGTRTISFDIFWQSAYEVLPGGV